MTDTDHDLMCANHGDCAFSVFIVTVAGRVDSVWGKLQHAQIRYRRLIGINGNQIGAAIQETEVQQFPPRA